MDIRPNKKYMCGSGYRLKKIRVGRKVGNIFFSSSQNACTYF